MKSIASVIRILNETVLKALAFPKLVYPLTVLESQTETISGITNAIVDFLNKV
ncbi:MAG: hypothetical protein ABW185_22365 [Sedimenticola sp.]